MDWKKYYKENREKKLNASKKWYGKNLEKCRQYHRQKTVQRKLTVINHYSKRTNKCLCCDETHMEFLSIDHINGGGSKHSKEIGKSRLYLWLLNNNLPEGFRVLCLNCNFAFGHYGYCPHKLLNN